MRSGGEADSGEGSRSGWGSSARPVAGWFSSSESRRQGCELDAEREHANLIAHASTSGAIQAGVPTKDLVMRRSLPRVGLAVAPPTAASLSPASPPAPFAPPPAAPASAPAPMPSLAATPARFFRMSLMRRHSPKSAILSAAESARDERRRLRGLMSRWSMPQECR